MKTRLFTIALMICSLLSGAASAQKKVIMDVILQDDKSGDYLIVTLSSGAYTFKRCKDDFAVGGVGKIEISGCRVSLQDISAHSRVLADIDLCQGLGKASIIIERGPSFSDRDYPPTLEFVVDDSNIRDSIAECKAAEK
jgi:hypothetical protein